ncbi:MAG: TrpR like protein, YerC/YecD [Caedimonadaceae bacterium]|nr:MAG: TrpR like protein, YerC/YecD [Caedimonadaceae bacterium]
MKSLKSKPEALDRFCDALLSLKTREECASFLRDLCTPSEMEAMVGRLDVALLLHRGGKSYRDIHDETGVSLVTIGRVARFLLQEDHQGYRRVLERLDNNNKNDQ